MVKTSTGYKLGIANIILLSIQTEVNVIVAIVMHRNLSDTSGEHAIGTVFVAFILILFKLAVDLIFLPVIPISIAGIVQCSSKKEIEQDRKKRLLGRKINIVCLVTAVSELVFLW